MNCFLSHFISAREEETLIDTTLSKTKFQLLQCTYYIHITKIEHDCRTTRKRKIFDAHSNLQHLYS